MRRAAIYLNTKQWKLALESALPVIGQGLHSASISAAVAAFELDQRQEATRWFVHAIATRPRAVAMTLEPYGLAEPLMVTPSSWTLTESSRDVRIPV